MSPKSKKILFKRNQTEKHWVGDGFFVSTMIDPNPQVYGHFDPFILLDYAAPKDFPAHDKKRGVGEHPHRGFETVTFAIQGEIAHRDSGGGGGTIKQGEVQWMTAGSGLVHEEFFSSEFSKRGGTLEMVQLWVNLPAKHKMTKPKYQGILDSQIPIVTLESGVRARVIAGALHQTKGPASTHTDINVYDIQMTQKSQSKFELQAGTNTLLLCLRGSFELELENVATSEIAVLSQEGSFVEIKSAEPNTRILLLNGAPINEPVAARGPFVMNTMEEINQAIFDFQSGKMGRLSTPVK